MSSLIEELSPKFQNLKPNTEKLPFKTPDLRGFRKGEVVIGHALDEYGHAVGTVSLPLSVFPEHVGVYGTTGTGKTWFILRLVINLILNGVTVWVLDTQREFIRYLLYLLGLDNVDIYNENNFRRNPLEEAENYFRNVARVKQMLRELYLRDGSLNLLGDVLKDLKESNMDQPATHLVDAAIRMGAKIVSVEIN